MNDSMPKGYRLSSVDAMRGIAILVVILVHTSQVIPNLPEWARSIAAYGQTGVQAFFVASAYTLCLALEQRSGEPRRLASFYLRRFFRIAPLYYLAIILYFALHIAKQEIQSNRGAVVFAPYLPGNIVANALFIHGFVPSANNSVVPGGWSIGTEMAFYAIFPAIYSLVSRAHRLSRMILPGFLLVWVAGNVAFQLLVYSPRSAEEADFYYFSLPNQFPVFLFGIIAHFSHKDSPVPPPKLLQFLGLVALSGCAYLALGTAFPYRNAMVPVFAGLSYVCLLNVLRVTSPPRIMCRIGQLSFSMYVFHFVFAWFPLKAAVRLVPPGIPPIAAVGIGLLGFLLVTVLTYAVASITWAHIEQRGIAAGNAIVRGFARK